MTEYSETAAVDAMRSALTGEAARTIDSDELLNIIDIIWDWYDDNGLLDLETDAELDAGALKAHVRKMIAKDKLSPISPDAVDALVDAELAYEASIEE